MTDKQGWGWPGNSRKSHYFIDGHALCGKWLFLGLLQENQNTADKPGPDDCAACHKKLLKRLPTRNPPKQDNDQNVNGESP